MSKSTPPRIGGTTRVIALLGDPVAHSLSPRIQNAAFRATAVNGVYVAVRCDPDEVPGLVLGISRGGGAGNVTVPHKELVARVVEEPSDVVRRTGACNTFWLEGDRVHGDNTDVAGFRGAVRTVLGRPPLGARVLLLGAGGAARAALLGLAEDGAAEVVIRNRSADRAERLVAEMAPGLGGRTKVVAPGAPADPAHRAAPGGPSGPFDLVVNATSLGLHDGDPLPIDLAELEGVGVLLDLVYRPRETDLVRGARERGISAADGGDMLVLQGAEAFRHWWGRPAPLLAMRQALEEAREEVR